MDQFYDSEDEIIVVMAHRNKRVKIDMESVAPILVKEKPLLSSELNDKQKLQEEFNELNQRYLHSKWHLEWSNTKRRWGDCSPLQKRIRLSEHMLKLHNIDELRNTLRHEVAHAITFEVHGRCQQHGPEWKKWAIQLGAIPKACRAPKQRVVDPKAKYILRHVDTHEVFANYYKKRSPGLKPGFIRGRRAETEGKLEIVLNTQ